MILTWAESEGATQYSIVYRFLNESFVQSINFTSPTSYRVVNNLVPGEMYRFVVYVGNDFGIDYLNGPAVEASTLSEFFSSFSSSEDFSTHFPFL